MQPPIVIVRPDRLGDVVLTSGLLAPLVRHFSHTRPIVWSVAEKYSSLFGAIPGIGVVPVEQLCDYMKHTPTCDIVFLNPAPRLEAALKKKHRVFGWGWTAKDLRKLCALPEAEECRALLFAAGFPIESAPQTLLPLPVLPKVRLPGRSYVVLHVSAHGKKPTLPAATIIELTRQLTGLGQQVVWLGGATRELEKAARQLEVIWLREELPILELAAWLRDAHGVVGRDSGPAHLAAAIGVPTVVLVGPLGKRAALKRWAPVGPWVRAFEQPLKPRWYEGTMAYQKRVFAAVEPRKIIDSLHSLWRCQAAQ